jgi:hypothetical protein
VTTARRLSGPGQWAGSLLLILLLTRPLVFGGSDRGTDFYTHYWYVWHQSEALRDGGPSLFLHNTSAVFTPLYAFYGGTLYVITGALALLLGSPLHAYVLTYLLAFVASYGGWWWLARQAGLRGLATHAPGLVFVTTAYAMTLLYVRGDWPEHVAVAMLPLLAASGLSVLRADRLRAWPAVALAVSVVVFTGSHNLSLLCGTVVLAVTIVLLLLCVEDVRRMVTRAGILRLLAIVVPAVLVNAWFLVPDLVLQSSTNISNLKPEWEQFLREHRPYVDLRHLLTLSRGTVQRDAPHYAFALPVLAMAWTVAAVAVARPRRSDPWLRALAALVAAGALVLFAMTHVGVLRGPFVMLQFSYRLESYVNLMVSGGVLIGLVLLRARPAGPGRARTGMQAALGLIAVVSVLGAVWQSEVHRDPATYEEWHAFPGYYTAEVIPSLWDYAEANQPYLDDASQIPHLSFSPQAITDGSVSATITTPPGSPVLTNVVGLWSLLDLTGGTFVGIGPGGRAIVQPDADALPGSTLTVTARHPPAFVIGRWLSYLGLAGLVANLLAIGLRARRRRVRSPRVAEPVGTPTAV